MRNNKIQSNTPSKFFCNASQIFSPSSTSRHDLEPPIQNNSLKLNKEDKKTQNILANMKIKFLLTNLVKKLRYLSPPKITPLNVGQQWQNQQQQESKLSKQQFTYTKQTLSDELIHKYEIFRHLNLIQGVISILICWIITTSVVFQQKFGQTIFFICLTLTILRIVLIFSFALQEKKQENQNYWINILGDDLINPFILLVACILFLIYIFCQTGAFQYIIQGISIVIVCFQYKQIGNYFSNIVRYAQQNKMKKQLRIIELFGLIFTLAHCFALIMYGMTYLQGHRQTWLDKAHLNQQNWSTQYIYSFYWAITTMVTVGYGDLTPQNQIQVIFVTSIQIVGTAIFGYMINVIGLTVDQIKKKNQQFENHQSTISKLRDHYKLSRQLCHRMKHDIKQKENQLRNIPLKTSEQKQFLEYIQPNLKEQFLLQTNMKVIKKSIFFLTHFSVNFQNQIALKLIRIIYKSEEQITTIFNQEERNLVIINNGSVDIFYQMNHNNIQINKKVRTIKPSEDNLTMNVFGYSSLILNKNIKLKAITKESAASYVLLRKDILECIDKNMLDFQSFNQMRQKMILYQKIQQIQAPQLKENQYHYVPNIFVLQKKIKYENQSRINCRRDRPKRKCKLITAKNYQSKTLPKIQDQKIETIGYINEDDFHSLISFDVQKNQANQLICTDQTIFERLKIDQCKIFQNFMKSSNLPIVAAAYQKSCQKKSYRKRFSTSIFTKPGTFIMSNKKHH